MEGSRGGRFEVNHYPTFRGGVVFELMGGFVPYSILSLKIVERVVASDYY